MSNTTIRQQPESYTTMMQQPMLHEPPVVYGNSNIAAGPYYQTSSYQPYMSSPQYPLSYPSYSPQMMSNYYPNHEFMTSMRNSPPSTNSLPSSPRTPPNTNQANIMINPLENTLDTTATHVSTEERVKETIARANTIPIEFYQTEFLEYSQKSYQQKTQSKKRKRTVTDDNHSQNSSNKKKSSTSSTPNKSDEEEDDDDEDEEGHLNSTELRRQIHIQSEQKRRAQIKDGFEVLKSHLPGCNSNKKMSKAALLTRTVQQLQHMKKTQVELLAEVERLAEENLTLKAFSVAHQQKVSTAINQ